MRTPLVPTALAALSLLTGCPPRHDSEIDAFAEGLAAADRLWLARAQTGSLDASEAAYRSLLGQRPDSPEVLWRLSRVAWSHALLEPAIAATWYEVGREYGMGCLVSDPDIVKQLGTRGDRLDPETLATANVPAECLVFGAAHVVGLVGTRGAGAALDLEDASPLLDRASSASPTVEVALREWAAARVIVLNGGANSDARAHFRASVEAAPGLRFFREGAAAAFPDLVGTFGAFSSAPGWELENGTEPVSPAP